MTNNIFDWNEIVTKSVITSDGKDIGNVDGLETSEFVVKDG
jgi:sporulation protein YlmC with PRC-barrel domain